MRPPLRLGLFAGLVSLSLLMGCETIQTEGENAQAARLRAEPDSALRELIRLHIRDALGSDYIVDPDQLVSNGRLRATDRGRATATGEAHLIPPVNFQLERVQTKAAKICRLTREDEGTKTPDLILPDASVCIPIEDAS